jgi:1-acyl-sn-glycerol-3-phosphate acyltransferase
LNFSSTWLKIADDGRVKLMAVFEEEFERFKPAVRRLSNFALIGKKIMIRGKENLVKIGPNLIVGNHIGSFKDVATLLR